MIPLGDAVFAEVDEVDLLPALFHCSWCLNNAGYAIGTVSRKTDFLHWFVARRMKLVIVETVDHIDRNKLNCRRENLRPATYAEQQANKNQLRTNTSGYKCISWHISHKKWRVSTQINGVEKHIAMCASLEAAVAARNAFFIRHNMELPDDATQSPPSPA